MSCDRAVRCCLPKVLSTQLLCSPYSHGRQMAKHQSVTAVPVAVYFCMFGTAKSLQSLYCAHLELCAFTQAALVAMASSASVRCFSGGCCLPLVVSGMVSSRLLSFPGRILRFTMRPPSVEATQPSEPLLCDVCMVQGMVHWLERVSYFYFEVT